MKSLSRSMKTLCRRFDDLQQMLSSEPLSDYQDDTDSEITDDLPYDGVLLEIDDDYIRYLCKDRSMWLRGLDYFMQGRVTARSVHWNMLRANVKGRNRPYYDTQAIFEGIADGGFRASIGCNCMAFRDNKKCKHVVALLVAWVRKPESFEVCKECSSRYDFEMPDIKAQTDKILDVTSEIAMSIKQSSWREDFEMLQNLHVMSRNLARCTNLSTQRYFELSQASSMVFMTIFSLLDIKYGHDMIVLYNNTMSDLMAKMIEKFVDSNKKTDAMTVPDAKNLFNTKPEAGMKMTSQIVTGQPSRSWDGIIDEFKKQA